MVDAADLKSATREGVGVRVPSWVLPATNLTLNGVRNRVNCGIYQGRKRDNQTTPPASYS